ncbi:MAG: AbrB/MazE/SpoVT family DNA-binding domain-containing protein [Clostridia bacterium]|nr:AbrB/MazE/SpoVT family DNA-binding domain-containing protein [Clostridia bacterium]
MKSTGIVRRIDDLGRVVIPKELRRTMRITEGDSLEIFVGDGGEVIFKKYDIISSIADIAEKYATVIHFEINATVAVITDEKVIAVSGMGKKELLGKEISADTAGFVKNGKSLLRIPGERGIILVKDNDDIRVNAIFTVSCEGIPVGAIVAVVSDNGSVLSDETVKCLELAAKLLSKELQQ